MSNPSEHRDSPTSAAASPPPLRFGLKSIFVLTAIVAILAAGASAGGLAGFTVATIGVLVLALIWAIFTERKKLATLFGWLSLLASITAFFIALLIPVRGHSGPASNRNTCQNNLKQVALALLNYEDKMHFLPPVSVSDDRGKLMHSWRTLILPDVEEAKLHSQYDFNRPWNSPANDRLTNIEIEIFKCPSDTSLGPYDTSYVAIIGPGTAWQADRGTKLSEITDGTSNTILLVEMKNSGIRWAEPRDLDLAHLPPGITPQNLLQSLSNHTGVVNAVFADGHVEGIPDTLPWSDFMALLTIAGGETVDRSKW